MADFSRRTAVAGTLATLALLPPGRRAPGEVRMRQILVAVVGRRAKRLTDHPHSPLYRGQVEIARKQLADLDRGAGLWHKLARHYADGLPADLVPTVSIRRFPNQELEATKHAASERSTPTTRARAEELNLTVI